MQHDGYSCGVIGRVILFLKQRRSKTPGWFDCLLGAASNGEELAITRSKAVMVWLNLKCLTISDPTADSIQYFLVIQQSKGKSTMRVDVSPTGKGIPLLLC